MKKLDALVRLSDACRNWRRKHTPHMLKAGRAQHDPIALALKLRQPRRPSTAEGDAAAAHERIGNSARTGAGRPASAPASKITTRSACNTTAVASKKSNKASQARPAIGVGDVVEVDAHRCDMWCMGVVEDISSDLCHFQVALKQGGGVKVPRSLVARAPAPHFSRKPKLDMAAPRSHSGNQRGPRPRERNHVRRNIEEAKAEAGEGFAKGSRQ